ncbi:MAG: carboxymuconolactone decarboxylase family protein [Deltaproteobacteria bacterium]|nr:MAG: carboxymuconolactone decarboxylase family protein [Deltaproteobacteria bacterium]
MSGSRVALLEPEAARKAAEAAGVPAAFAELNIFRVLLHRPAAAKGMADLLVSLLFRGELDHRLRELVIMRIGWATGSDYEWTQHWSIARERFGVSADDLLALRDWRRSDRFGPAERAVLEATDETLATGTVSEATWTRCTDFLNEAACIELVAAVGCWRMVSQLTRSLAIPLEAGVASWPPDGAAPSRA